VVIWYIFPRFGTLHHEKSGSPERQQQCCGFFWSRFHNFKNIFAKEFDHNIGFKDKRHFSQNIDENRRKV
jgi:hypothetical protein